MTKPRIVVAGQVPPPFGGQNVMIARILAEFAADARFDCEHLAFHFTPDFKDVRRGSVAKIFELVRVIGRLLALRLRGPIDALVFPAGGPQTVPIVRDILLLPWVLLAARRVVVQFHAAGIAERCAPLEGGAPATPEQKVVVAAPLCRGDGLPSANSRPTQRRGGRAPRLQRSALLCRVVAALYRRCFAAIVMTEFNRRDPEFCGIRRVAVIPHKLPDEFDPSLVRRDPARLRLLYVGHLCADKGTPELLRAFKLIADRGAAVVLELVGEALPPFSDDQLRALIRELGLEDRVEVRGLLTGRAKLEAFGRADLFVFPSVAPYESFGLVMVEAMMWGLPIVATDWRGNREVLGADFEGVCFPIGADFAASLAEALGSAIETSRGKTAWTGRNRRLFLERYRADAGTSDYRELAQQWIAKNEIP